jgi:hypothetical protein
VRPGIRFLTAGTILFLGGAAILLQAVEGGRETRFTAVGIVILFAAVACLGIGAWRMRNRPDWSRIQAEQRLWESGPLGRLWLRIRRALLGR